jgi:hypothetical protein
MHIGASPIAAAFSALMDLSQVGSTRKRFCANCKMGDRKKG